MQPSVDDLFRAAHDFHRAGKLLDAERLYRIILSRDPSHASALNYLGVIAMETGHLRDAHEWMRRSLVVRPDCAEFHVNFSETFRRAGDFPGALQALHRAAELVPDVADPLGRIAAVLTQAGRHAEAVSWARKALELYPQCVTALVALGDALIELRQLDEARAVLRRSLELDPTNKTTAFYLAAVTEAPGENAPEPPPGLAKRLFDNYAHNFDEHLVGSLRYRGPEMLRQAIDRVRPEGKFDILDLGCGTGLVGLRFADRARSLIGVDLSQQMLAKAFERKIYQRLEVADLVTSLQARGAEFDLILAGDVFIYVGDLRAVFAAAAHALRPGGLFAFTVETHEGTGFVVRVSRRYAHSREYIESLAATAGFEVVAAEPGALRVERGAEIDALVFVLGKPARADPSIAPS
jgi:predicted TPR repeat methyltransferase